MTNSEQYRREILDILGIWSKTVSMKTTSGLTDSSTASEIIMIETLRVSRGWELVSANQINAQAPAVDLVDETARIAIQVTNIANSEKIRHSYVQFDKMEPYKKYDELYVVGTSKVSVRPKDVPTWVHPITLEKLLRISSLTRPKLESLHHVLMNEIEPHHVGRGDDRYCFEQFLEIIDRPAIRDHTDREGNYKDMLTALKEVQNVIKKGSIPGYWYSTKSSIQYADPQCEEVLATVSLKLRDLINILNREADCNSVYFTEISRITQDKINVIRLDIIEVVNKFCQENGYLKRLDMDFGQH